MKRILLALSLLLVFMFFSTAAKPDKLPAISVRARPQVVVSAPLETLSIEVIIPRNTKNRQYCVEVDGPNFYSSDCQDLAGDEAPVIHQSYVLHLDDDGEYLVQATLFGENNKQMGIATQKVEVGVVQADDASPTDSGQDAN